MGTGPSYGVAMFSAAKVLEASGDPAMAQETEEWAHIQYFSAQPNTPTVFISAADFDAVRMAECVAAAKLLGRRTAVVVPQSARAEDIIKDADVVLPVKGEVREAFWPLVASIPGELIAAERAEAIGAKYFQDFKGGRESDGVSRPSRIYDSAMLDEVRS